MREVVAGGSLERVPERVTQVELVARPAIMGIGDAHPCLERGAPPHELGERLLPDRAPHQQARLYDLRHPVPELLLGERLERPRIDHDPGGPVERPDEVLAAGKIDRGLASDRRVDLADERRRHRHPRHPAHVGGRGEPGKVGRAAAAEADDRAVPADPQCAPEPLEHRDRLRGLAGRDLVARRVPIAERELRSDAVDPGHVRVGDDLDGAGAGHELLEQLEGADPDIDPGSGEHDPVGVVGMGIGDLFVDGSRAR